MAHCIHNLPAETKSISKVFKFTVKMWIALIMVTLYMQKTEEIFAKYVVDTNFFFSQIDKFMDTFFIISKVFKFT